MVETPIEIHKGTWLNIYSHILIDKFMYVPSKYFKIFIRQTTTLRIEESKKLLELLRTPW